MTMLRAMILAAAVGPFGADVVAAQGVPQGEVAKKLVGAWRYVGTTVDGVNKPRGNNPKGMARCRCRLHRTSSANAPARS